MNPEEHLGRIYDYMKRDLSIHNKIVNIWLLSNKAEDFPELPPLIVPCLITLYNGSRFKAYRDTDISQDWIEYGNTFSIRRNGRRMWCVKEVESWEISF